MKTALVTGSAGFIGRHMTRELESRGYLVWGVDLPGYDAHSLFRETIQRYDLVVHCAFHVGGRAAIDGVNTNFLKNLQLDSAMFEWAVRTKQKRVLYFSSSAAYPVGMQSEEAVREGYARPLKEVDCPPMSSWGDFNWLPDSNYGWAKLTGERMAQDARLSGLPVTVVRPFSGYGEDQSLDYPFPSIVQRAKTGDLSVWGPPGQTRDWIHVDDVVRGALSVVESGTEDPVNLCTGVGTEIGELAQMISVAAGWYPGEHEPTYLTDKPTGVFYRVGDPTRMLQYYTPTVSLKEGIRRALAD